MTKAQKPPRAHHVLPQFYLRAWANDKGRIGALLRDGKSFETGAEALAVEKDFYTADLPDGTKDPVVETALAEVDGKGSSVHTALLDLEFPISPHQKMDFSYWLGLQWVRGRNSRATSHELADKLQKMILRMGLENAALETGGSADSDEGEDPPDCAFDEGEGFSIPDFSHLTMAEREQMESEPDDLQFELSSPAMLLQMLKMMIPAASPFHDSEWHLLVFDGPLLLTSDEPIILQRDWRPDQFLGVGPASADQMLVSSHHPCALR